MENHVDTLAGLKIRPETISEVCEHVANGGSLIDRCKLWGVSYGKFVDWLNSDPMRADRYARALESKMHWSIDRVLKELELIGLADVGEAYTPENKLKDIHDIPESLRRCIVSVESEELFDGVGKEREHIGYTKKIKFIEKTKALELIGKKFAMWIDRSRIDLSTKTIEDLIVESMKDESIPAEILPAETPEKKIETDSEIQGSTPPPGGNPAPSA